MSLLNRYRISIITRLVSIFLIVIIPLYLLNMYINNIGANIIRKEIEDSMMSRVNFYLETVENDIGRIRVQQMGLSYDSDVQKLDTFLEKPFDFEKLEVILKVQKRLNTIKESNPYFKEIMVFYPQTKEMINSINIYKEVDKEYNAYLNSITVSNTLLCFKDGNLFLYLACPNTQDNNKPLYFIIIEYLILNCGILCLI